MNILMLEKNSRCLFNAIRRVLQGKEKATASIVYETIWSWFLKYFDEDKAGVMEAIHKPGAVISAFKVIGGHEGKSYGAIIVVRHDL